MRLLHEEVEYDIKESILPEDLKTDPSWIRRWFGNNRVVATLSRLLGTCAGRPTLVQTTPGGALSVSGAVSPYGGVRLYYVTRDLSYSLPSGSTERVWIVPMEGYITRVIGVYTSMPYPTGATSGTHEWGLCMMSISQFGIWGSGPHNLYLNVENYLAGSGFNIFFPARDWSQIAYPLVGTHDEPLQSYYINKTDVANTNTRHYTIGVAEYPAVMP